MYLKNLEMTGFKSFVNPTRLEFPNAFSAIVGPNGCGKSNIVDAIRWVIGEQSTKTLRGSRMEDLIFNGSDSRKSLGMAEVSLTVGNLPFKSSIAGLQDLDEVTVTRRYFRSGESEYLINKTPCRMKDIVDLFLDTGISSKAYSIIEQDHVGQIISAKPEDRRFLIEETAGVMKYKHRKKEALRKLESTTQNLLRINDVTQELDKQRRSLKRQAKKAEVYKKFKQEARELGLTIHSIEYKNKKDTHNSLEEKLSELKNKQEELLAKNAALQNKIEIHKAETEDDERQLNLLKQQNYEINSKIENLETRIEMMKKQVIDQETNGNKAETEIEQMREDIEEFEQLIEKQRKELEIVKNDIAVKENIFNEKYKTLRELKDHLQLKTNRLEEIETDLVDTLNAYSNIKNNEASLVTRSEILEQNKTKLIQELTDSERNFTDLDTAVKKNEEVLAQAKDDVLKIKDEKDGLICRLEEEKNRLKDAENSLSERKNIYTEQTALLNSLNELHRNFEGFHEGVKSLMKPQEGHDEIQGIHDVLINIIDTPSKYEIALEAALGEKLQGIVMNSHNESIEAVQYLKNKATGRSTFFLLNPILQTKPELTINGHRGIVGKMLGIVSYEEKYKDIMEHLLGNVIVVENMDSALSLWKSFGDNYTLVTLEGDVVDSHGTITGGGSVNNGAGLLSKKRKIKELKEETGKLKTEVESQEEKQGSIQKVVFGIEQEREALDENIHQVELNFRVEEKKTQQLNDNLSRSLEKLETCRFEKEQCETEEEELNVLLKQLQNELKNVKDSKLQREEEIRSIRDEITSTRSGMESLIQEVNGIDVERTSLKGKQENISLDIQRLCSSLELTRNRIEQKEEEKQEHENKKSDLLTGILESESEINNLAEEKNITEKEIIEQGEALEEKLKALKEFQHQAKTYQSDLQDISEQVNAFEINCAEIVKDLQYLLERAKDEFLATEEQMLQLDNSEFDQEAGKARLEDLKSRLEKIGEVSLAALEEYKKVNERYTFLLTQQEDLQKSITDLQETINKINRTTKKKFLETFELINENFKNIFVRLFKGGHAELILSDNDILETGIEISVKPPGKNLQNLNLLSGGEKAMTAIALLFAIFAVKPSPFCLLDEVDAALDQTNIDRFKEMLMEMKEKTQFILVTHSQKTMSFADTLYGITMEEKGVSKVVSVALD